MCNKINILDHLSTQEFDTFADLLSSERPDYFRWGRAQIPLVDAGLSRLIGLLGLSCLFG